MLEFFKKNISNQFIRICKIQYNSKLRGQQYYPDHHYKLTISLDGIGNPITAGNVIEKVADIYTYNETTLIFTNDNNFYLKTTTSTDSSFIEIGYDLTGQYSTNIKCKIETVEGGSVQFYCDEATKSEYTRQQYFGGSIVSNAIMKDSTANSWLNTNTTIKCNVVNNRPIKVTDMINNVVSYMLYDGTLYNSDNASFTLTISASDTYKRELTVVTKRQVALFIEIY